MKNLKFKNLAMATVAVLSLAACNNSDDNAPAAADSAVKVALRVPSATRGIVTDPTTTDITISSVAAKVGNYTFTADMDNQNVPNTYSLQLKEAMLDGTEKLLVVANNGTNASTTVGIEQVQPTEEAPMLGNAIYAATANLSNPTEEEGKKVYTVNTEAKSIVARLEVSGKAKFNKELVKDMYMSTFTPAKYSLIYNGDVLKQPSASKLMTKFASADEAKPLAEGKVLANHLFDGDEASAIMGYTIVKYACHTTGDDAYTFMPDSKSDAKHFLYLAEDDKYYVNMGNLETPEYHFCNPEIVGEKVKVNMDEKPVADSNAIVLKTVKETKYFALGKFKNTKDGAYEGGKIYKLDLEKDITWNPGSTEFPDTFNPDTNKGGDDIDTTVNKKEAQVNVSVTVAPWNEVNTSAEVI